MSLRADYAAGALGPLVLGGAQLGLAYGIANRDGKPAPDEVADMVDAAWAEGLRVIDTAQGYGDSEVLIGDRLRTRPQQRFHVVSKLAAGLDERNPDTLRRAVEQSVARVGQPLAAMLLHDPEAVARWGDGPRQAFARCRADGLIELAGVSVYNPRQFAAALAIDDLDVIQAPFNALDRRLLDDGLLGRALDSGRIVFLRSVYLQGLLLLDPAALPPGMDFAREALRGWQAACREIGLEPLEAALRFVRSAAPRCPLVVGCDRPAQVRHDARLAAKPPLAQDALECLLALPPAAERIVNPSLWNRP